MQGTLRDIMNPLTLYCKVPVFRIDDVVLLSLSHGAIEIFTAALYNFWYFQQALSALGVPKNPFIELTHLWGVRKC